MRSKCTAIVDRACLTAAIEAACEPGMFTNPGPRYDGSEKQLVEAFDVLKGIVGVYHDGGDQIVETCDCGRHH